MKASPFSAKVVAIESLTSKILGFRLEPDEPLVFEPGQFLALKVPGSPDPAKPHIRYYSFASPPESKYVELCIEAHDKSADYFRSLKTGDRVEGTAPYGNFKLSKTVSKAIAFIADATGLVPYRAMVLARDNYMAIGGAEKIYCLHAANPETQGFYAEDFKKLSNLEFRSLPNEEGILRREVAKLALPWNDTQFYLCGTGEMVEDLKDLLEEHSVQKDQVHQEIFYWAHRKPKPGLP